MGQRIEVLGSTVVGDSIVFDTDRSITGQDGVVYETAEQAGAGDAFPDVLAQRLFASDDGVASVFVASNTVTVTRTGGWDAATVAAASGVVADFFVFYAE